MILWDLDGTLCHIEHRRHLVTKPRGDWQAFYRACVGDVPNLPALDLLRMLLQCGAEVQIWSGREQSVEIETRYWFWKHAPFLVDEQGHLKVKLRMRPTGDHTPDDVLKERWLTEARSAGAVITAVFDDRNKVVAMWRRNGILCCQVAEGDF